MHPYQTLRLALGLILAGLWLAQPALAQSNADLQKQIRDAVKTIQAIEAQEKRDKDLSLGREVYKAACMTCHGLKGNGKGPSAKWLDPRPRDFTSGIYKWRTTPYGKLPLEEDIERTIREGVSGTDMFPFGEILSHKSRLAVARYIMHFSSQFDDPDTANPEPVLIFPLKRPFPPSEASAAKGKTLFATKGCNACHGNEGEGDGIAGGALVDSWGYPIKPWDFTLGYYKSGANDADLFRTITTGPFGTPMPGYGPMTSEAERWNLVDYIRSLSKRQSGIITYLLREEPSGRVYREPAR